MSSWPDRIPSSPARTPALMAAASASTSRSAPRRAGPSLPHCFRAPVFGRFVDEPSDCDSKLHLVADVGSQGGRGATGNLVLAEPQPGLQPAGLLRRQDQNLVLPHI